MCVDKWARGAGLDDVEGLWIVGLEMGRLTKNSTLTYLLLTMDFCIQFERYFVNFIDFNVAIIEFSVAKMDNLW